MKHFSKMLLILAAMFVFATSVDAKSKHGCETKKLQILIALEIVNPFFKFRMNDGGSLVADPFAPRPVGASYSANGLIYPGDTIDTKNQTSFLKSKQGIPLTEANSIGYFWEEANVLTDYLLAVPQSEGTIFNLSEYAFSFKKGDKPALFGTGFIRSTGVVAGNQEALTGLLAEIGGTEGNKGADKQFEVKFIPAPDFLSLVIEVKFKKAIEIS